MFLEKTAYSDDFPLSISIVNIQEYPIHYHQDIEIVFVLKGDILLKNGSCTYRLYAEMYSPTAAAKFTPCTAMEKRMPWPY